MACPHNRTVADKYLQPVCVECRREKGRKHYAKNKENVLAKCAEYRKNNPEKIKEIKARYKARLSVTLLKKRTPYNKQQLELISKLKSVIYEVNQIERAYYRYRRLA